MGNQIASLSIESLLNDLLLLIKELKDIISDFTSVYGTQLLKPSSTGY
jgi:hypothetical protein